MSKKKSFIDKIPTTPLEPSDDSVVEHFFSKPKASETAPASASTPSTGLNPPPIDGSSATALLTPPKEEKKDKHVHLVLKPSLFKRIEAVSTTFDVSMNKFFTVGAELLLSAIEKKQTNK